MTRTWAYHGFTIEVGVEADFNGHGRHGTAPRAGYEAVVSVIRAGASVAVFSPLRFGDSGGRPFATEADALIGGYSAACKIVDDLFSDENLSQS
jgi:hypothetical protein